MVETASLRSIGAIHNLRARPRVVETDNRARARARVVETATLRSIGAIHNLRARPRVVETENRARARAVPAPALWKKPH